MHKKKYFIYLHRIIDQVLFKLLRNLFTVNLKTTFVLLKKYDQDSCLKFSDSCETSNIQFIQMHVSGNPEHTN